MAFQPVSNFETFIREYLLEPGMPDVKAVKASVDAHRRAKDRLETMHDQHQRLERICERHSSYLETQREARLFEHLRDALAHEEKKENLEGRREKLRSLRQQNQEQQTEQEEAVVERNELDQQLSAVRLVAGNDSQIAHLAQNRARYEEVGKELELLRDAAKTAHQYLLDRTQHWKSWLKHAGELELEQPPQTAEWLKQMQGADEAPALDAASRMTRIYQMLLNDAGERLRPLEDKIREQEAREARLKKELEDLANKGSTAPSPLLDALRSRGQKAVALGRVIEVKPEAEAWWPLLETLLGTKRQAVLPESFTAAWDQAQRLGHIDEPLVNPDELGVGGKTVASPVAAFFDTAHQGARAYLEHLYGGLAAVEKVRQLDKHERGLSLDGWLKDPPLRLHLSASREFTIGEEGLRRLRSLRQEELELTRTDLEKLRRESGDWKKWLHLGKEWRLDDADPPSGTSGLRDLPRLKKERQALEETIRLLATPEREATVEKLRVLQKTFEGVVERIGSLRDLLQRFEQQEKELLEGIATLEEDEQSAIQTRRLSREGLAGTREAEIEAKIDLARQEYPKWSERINAAAALVMSLKNESRQAREDRDRERYALAEKHPETAEFFDPADDANERYDRRRRELEEHELERYRIQADDAQREWEERLQHQVLDVLKEKLDEAERTKKELNRAMDHDIGGWRYQLSMRADRSHSAIWSLVDKGLNPSLELFAAGVKEEIESAKAALMAAIENPEDSRQQKVLDYRYYHHWDIQATPVGGGEGSAISLNKSAKKQSGGENQAPFFVAMLAAFQRVYDLGRKEQRKNLGVVIMDEAFSKLSGDRIDACLALARNFGLQLVMAFPEDRLPTMIQHAETVVQARVERIYDERSGTVRGIENWCVRVDRERLMDAFS
jgi:hypothetical protein